MEEEEALEEEEEEFEERVKAFKNDLTKALTELKTKHRLVWENIPDVLYDIIDKIEEKF